MSTVATNETKPAAPAAPAPVDKIKIKIDGREVEVPKLMPDWQGKLVPTTMLQACHLAGHEVPHYCYHPKLPIAGNCRMCLVEFGLPAMGPDRKPVLNEDGSPKIAKQVLPYDPTQPRGAIACATPISPGMEIYPSSPATKQMREGVLEGLLINHPLDCPICDQAGECKLQEYSVQYGQAESRFAEAKVHKPKAVDLGPRIVLDDERCILCTRCVRFTKDIVGDDKLGIVNRGSYNTIAAYPGTQFDNNYTLNTVDICPVGALTSKDFRFQMRVWFLKETKSICTSCGTGCNIVIGSREEKIYRYEPRENDAVNATWMCDAGRLNYKWVGRADRLKEVLVRGQKTTWASALGEISEKLRKAPTGSVAIVASARQTNEELFLLKKLATKLGAITDSVPRAGEGDKLLVNTDKNPNTNGARLTGIAANPMGTQLAKIADGIKSGAIKTLVVFGEDVTKHGISTDLLAKLETLIVSDILPSKTTAIAHYLLPGCAHAEKRGSFTNVKGRVQRFLKAVEATGDARPEWAFLHELVYNVTGHNGFATIEGLFNQMAKEVPAFNGLTWAGIGDTGVTVPYLIMDWNFLLFAAIKIGVVFGVVMTMVAYAVLVERKVCALIQDRVGPNRAAPPFISAIPIIGPFLVRLGIFHPMADGLKLFLKEDFTPAHVRKIYFWLAPAITMIPALLTVAIIPFGSQIVEQRFSIFGLNIVIPTHQMVIADLNVGVLYTFGIVSLGVYGIVLAGYASNSKFPFLGGIRSTAQMISYELAMGMSVIPIFLLVGDLSLSKVIEYQASGGWMIFKQPLAFAIFIVAALAETNRMPFDFPEAEQELAGGYNVEYSSMKFGMFFMGEYANMVMSSALVATLFLGGWTLPWFGLDQTATTFAGGLLHIGIFLAKLGAVLLLMIWVRWMLPRFRYDQLMDLGWRRFIPLALANIVVTAVWLWMKA